MTQENAFLYDMPDNEEEFLDELENITGNRIDNSIINHTAGYAVGTRRIPVFFKGKQEWPGLKCRVIDASEDYSFTDAAIFPVLYSDKGIEKFGTEGERNFLTTARKSAVNALYSYWEEMQQKSRINVQDPEKDTDFLPWLHSVMPKDNPGTDYMVLVWF